MKFSHEDTRFIVAASPASTNPVYTPASSEADDELSSYSDGMPTATVPWPGNFYMITTPATGDILTLKDGQVMLAPPSDNGDNSVLWRCTESDGWLGFQNPISGCFLGRDKNNQLSCFAKQQQGWEHFITKPVPDGSFILKQEHRWALSHIGRSRGGDRKTLAKMNAGSDEEAVRFTFHEVRRKTS